MTAAFWDGEGVGGEHQEVVATGSLDGARFEEGAAVGAVDELAVDGGGGDQSKVVTDDQAAGRTGYGDLPVLQVDCFREALRRGGRAHGRPLRYPREGARKTLTPTLSHREREKERPCSRGRGGTIGRSLIGATLAKSGSARYDRP